MKKFLIIVFLFNCLIVVGQNNLNLVPMPVKINKTSGEFLLNKKTCILAYTKSHEEYANLLNSYLKELLGYVLPIKQKTDQTGNFIYFSSQHAESNTPGEGYHLKIKKDRIEITSRTSSGAFYGIQTLIKFIPHSKPNSKFSIPCLDITDYPRFQYRGMHFDVGRHFFPVSFIKKYIDYLAAYKYNKFHWHLTEDQGWRIEIKKYPELTTIGAWRNGTIIGRYPGKGSDNKAYGGYYTQEEIKEVVAYAAARYIDVIPEIEMPGHSSAAIAAYPWLSCFAAKPTEIPASMISEKSRNEQKNGRIKLVQETWGVFDDVFCAGKDSTFKFLENVIDEVIALFPSKYFHIGADECPKTHWKICPACQQRMKANNLKDEHELQSWFVQRIEKYLNSKGKILIGWDEILEGGLAPNAVVMSWRGEKGGIEAARQKHQVIMTPGNPVYFDHTQSRNEDSVTIGGYNSIEAVYNYEPIPKELSTEEGKYVLGAQANMWTEYMEYSSKVEYMMFPRMTALSEVLWSPKEKRDWKDFERRLPAVFKGLDEQKINYSKAYYDLKTRVTPTKNFHGIEWKLESKDTNAFIHYETILPIGKRYKYTGPVQIDRNTIVNAWSSSGGTNSNKISEYFKFNKATGKKITLATEASKNYPGDGAFTLVNGVQNEKGLNRSSEFLGFLGTDLDATIDLGKDTEVSSITLHLLGQHGSWIYLPTQIEVSFIPFIDTTVITRHSPIESVSQLVQDEKNEQTIRLPSPKTCRYIRVYAKNYGIIPAGKPGAGHPAWLFADEIEVN